MNNQSATSQSRSPIARGPTFGLSSVASPFVGALLFYVVVWGAQSLIGLLLLPLTPVAGAAFAVVSWFRGERHPWVAGLGFLFNTAIMVYLYVQRDHIIQFGC